MSALGTALNGLVQTSRPKPEASSRRFTANVKVRSADAEDRETQRGASRATEANSTGGTRLTTLRVTEAHDLDQQKRQDLHDQDETSVNSALAPCSELARRTKSSPWRREASQSTGYLPRNPTHAFTRLLLWTDDRDGVVHNVGRVRRRA